MTVLLDDKDLKKLEEKYKCNREVLNLALDYALGQFEEYIEHNLHDDVHDADLDLSVRFEELRYN